MKCGLFLVPLAAVEIVRVLFETGGLYDTEIGAVRNCTASAVSGGRTVPRSRFTEVVETGPYEFAGNTVILIRVVERIVRRDTPAYTGRVVRRQMIISVRIGIVILILILSSAVGRGRGFGSDDAAGVSAVALRERIERTCTVCIVEADNTICIDNSIEHINNSGVTAAVIVPDGYRTGTVFSVHPIDEVRTDIIVTADIIPIRTFLNFVAEGPCDDGGSVPVTSYHRTSGIFGTGHTGSIAVQPG